MKTLRQWPVQLQLRKWQQRAIRRLEHCLIRNDVLIVATPGSGKTMLALMIAHEMFREGRVERIVVVCPTDHLRKQWANAAARVGIDLDPLWSNADGVEAPDFFGVVVTYQQVSFAPDLYRMNCKQRTLVIFDEIHHAGDDLAWGTKLREAFEPATFRICMSGTPFRNDNNPIPFVTYKDGRSCADFEYGYKDALADGVCRPIYFPTYEGSVCWLSFDGREEDCSLLDPLSRAKAAERLRAALSPTGNWLRGVLNEANDKLVSLRSEGHTDAAGLVIAIDQEHAKRIGQLLHEITSVKPFVAISDEPDASDRIKRFAENSARWIVAVRMISEGVDIPRLRVGVYATNVQSELFFRQAVGRFVRVIDGLDEQSAFLYLPAGTALVRYALQIKEEREHQLTQEVEKLETSISSDSSGNESAAGSIFVPLGSDLKPHDTIFDGAIFNNADLAHAEIISREMGLNLPYAQVAALLRRGAAEAGKFIIHPSQTKSKIISPSSGPTKSERKLLLRKSVQRLTNRLAHMLGVEPREVHREWITLSGTAHGNATEEDFQRKKEWLIKRMKETSSMFAVRPPRNVSD
jgi:superfamily II DNA or RNA helicase